MALFSADDFVELTASIPELSLQRGEFGIIRSTWFAPVTAYEVEFHLFDAPVRILLLREQIKKAIPIT